MARYADVDNDLLIHVFVGDVSSIGKVLIPSQFDQLSADQLRYVSSEVIDVTGLTQFYIDDVGNKHAVQIDPGWQPLNCSWDTPIVKDPPPGSWRVRDYRDDLLVYSNQVRFSTERGGIFVDAGTGRTIPVDTSDRSKMLINEATTLAQINPDLIMQWHAADGVWDTVNASQVLTISQAVATHVQDCFTTGASVDADVRSGAITTNDQIDAEYAKIPTMPLSQRLALARASHGEM